MAASPQVNFHDLVALIDSKCQEIRALAGGDPAGREEAAIDSLMEARVLVIEICRGTRCPSYVYCPEPLDSSG